MSLTDDPDDIPEAGPPPERPDDHAQSTVPTIATLRWPIVQALRDVGRASDAELVELVADSLKLTDQQRAELIPSGQETRLRNRVSWAAHELKQIGAVYYPEPSVRALTALGNEIDDDQIKDLHRAFEAEERRRRKANKNTEQVPGPRAGEAAGLPKPGVDLSDLVEQFLSETGYPTEDHEEQKRLRAEWAEKLSPENVASLSREDLAAYTNPGVDYGKYVNPVGGVMQWISELDDAQYIRLLDSIRDLCWGDDELSTRNDRLVDWGGSRKDTGTKGFAQKNVSATLAICHPDRFLPVLGQEGVWGRVHMLRKLGLPEPEGATFGQQVVDANDRLRQHLAPHLNDDPLAIATFLYWLREDANGGNGAADLSALVERFRAESGYPTEAHEEQRHLRAEWAEKLAPENIADLSRLDLTGVASQGTWSAGTYVYPHVQGVMKWIRELDDDEYSRTLDHIRYLCWDEDDEPWRRFDQLIDSRSSRKTKGLKDSTTSRLLAISHPDDFLAIGVQEGQWGRAAMLQRLGLPKPSGSSHGQRVLDANDRLREHLEPYFGDDTLEMAAFLGWLLEQDSTDGLADLAERLLVDLQFLEDIVSLLKDKKQVILYGPPGTGKTYLARELAKELAADESCRALVQFHPSTSYEDFFEGYRPAKTGAGSILYELTPGPLKRMADKAIDKADQCHLMIIDEINRGNLPRVLGELLFLLEYRDESVKTLYRPDEPFALPENLWFIGTMNTADRSIALVDAALRRRFHFVPFFPDSGPMAGLLGRWLDRKDEPAWIGRLVDAVNNELKEILEGSHLLLGPSHFMKEYGSSLDTQRERLRRIWEYNIEPFIEDQFFGDPEQINRFRFTAVMARRGPPADARSAAPADSDEPADPDLVLDPNESKDGDSRLWRSRADNWPPAERAISGSTRTEQNSVVGRYVAFALQQDKNPGSRDKALVDAFLASLNLADSSQRDYRSHLNQWFNHQHGPVEGKR
ncbi:MAG: AAA family ATPase [Acidimicrobiaceae bacterium]|nr:AAA family ATPase [Acidimicrobiaceae bacterium]